MIQLQSPRSVFLQINIHIYTYTPNKYVYTLPGYDFYGRVRALLSSSVHTHRAQALSRPGALEVCWQRNLFIMWDAARTYADLLNF